MPNRSLLAVAIIVWSVAVLVAVLLGLPTLLTVAGVHVDAGLIVNALAAAGAFSAALAAVGIATSDRRERARERDAEDDVQAKLVVVQADRFKPPGIRTRTRTRTGTVRLSGGRRSASDQDAREIWSVPHVRMPANWGGSGGLDPDAFADVG